MRSYLKNRFQRVVIKDNMHVKSTSAWELIRHGVPQGSVLGPLLFLVHINDLARTIKNIANLILFADDTSIIVSNTDIQEFKNNLVSVMNKTIDWFQSNLLSMNYKKTHFLQFLTKQQNKVTVQIVVPDSIIPNVNSTKFLGLTIDSTLSWKGHFQDLSSKLNKACYAIRAVKLFMSLKVLKTACFSYFHSIMSHGIIFWGNLHINNVIFKIQKRLIRILTKKSKHDTCQHLFKQLQIPTLASQYLHSLSKIGICFC